MSRNKYSLVCFFDGACFPMNPGGTLGIGVAVYLVNNFKLINHQGIKKAYTQYSSSELIHTISDQIEPEKYSTQTTNNAAEWRAIRLLIEWINSHIHLLPEVKKIHIFGDSSLVVNQITGYWQVYSGKPYSCEAMGGLEAIRELEKIIDVKVTWIPREKNTVADLLSNPDKVKGNWEK